MKEADRRVQNPTQDYYEKLLKIHGNKNTWKKLCAVRFKIKIIAQSNGVCTTDIIFK